MLGAGGFALSAFHAGAGFTAACGKKSGIVEMRAGMVAETQDHIAGFENIWDVDLHRTALDTVPAVRTGDSRGGEQRFAYLSNDSVFFIIQRHEAAEDFHVVRQLFHRIHAGQNHFYTGQGCGKAESVGGGGSIRIQRLKICHQFRFQGGKDTALDRLHYHDIFSMLSAHFIVGAGKDGIIFPVHVVDLQLDEIHVGMIRQQLIQQDGKEQLRYVVTGEHGPDHSKTFEIDAMLSSNVVGHGTGRSKREAEQMAAKEALRLFGVEDT